jgi:FkbM family methyltransferase
MANKSIVPYFMLERILKIISFKSLYQTGVGFLKILKSIIFNNYIEKNNSTLSNYGVWVKNNKSDKTFKLSILGYRNNLDRFLLSIKEPTVFVDIGANQGIFSLVASKNVNIIEIHAFEPNSNIAKYLQNNFEINNLSNVTIHPVAISSKIGELNFLVPKYHSGAGKISNTDTGETIISVNRNYLREVLFKENFSYFIKIDVEGSELDVLKEIMACQPTINIKNIFVEINTKEEIRKVDTELLLRSNGFIEVYRKQNYMAFDALYRKVSE